MPKLGSQFRQYRAAEVENMTPEEFSAARTETATAQRGHPEGVMVKSQRAMGGGLYGWSMEHIGDLTHRMNEGGGRYGLEFVRPKVERAHHSLHHPYGFEREVGEQIQENQRFNERKGLVGATAEDVRRYGGEYAAAHKQVPVINEPSYRARSAAITLGEHDFDRTRTNLGILKRQTKDDTTWRSLTDQSASVQFLRHFEHLGIL